MAKGRRIEIPYSPRKWTLAFHNSDKRWKVLVLHRRAGKTTASINHLMRDALTKANTKYAYIAPTYKQAKNIVWDMLKNYARVIPDVKFNEAELRADFPNGSRITLYGADNPDSLRGIALWGVIFDEYSQQPSNIFTEIISPALSDNQGYAIWIGTPKGKNDFYKLYENHKEDSDWYCLLLKASESGVISEEELKTQRKLMSEDEYAQEFECSWEASIKGAYYADYLNKARQENRITNVPYDHMLEVHTWWDLGMRDSTTILFFQTVGMEWRLIDSYEASGEGFSHYAKVLKEKGYLYGQHYAPHDIEVRMMTDVTMTRKEIAYNLGIDFNVVPKVSIQDGIDATRMRFNTLWIDKTKNEMFLEAISQYRKEYDEKRGEFKSSPLHDWTSHYADALRYWAVTPFETEDFRLAYEVSKNREENISFR